MAFVDRANFPSLVRPEAHQHNGSDLVKGSVTADQLAAAAVTATKLANEAWATYTPTLTASITNPTMGTGANAQGAYVRAGRTIHGTARVQFGTAGSAAGSGSYEILLPVTPKTAIAGIGNVIIGAGFGYDASANLLKACVLVLDPTFGTGKARMYFTSDATGFAFGDAQPWVWGDNDPITVHFTYEAAS